MKILQVMAGGTHGGAETAFVDMCRAMHEAGMQIEVATRANKVRVPQLEKAGIKVHILPFGGPADLYTRWKMGRIIKQFKPQIVQTWMARAASKTPKMPGVLNVARLGGYYKLKHFKTMDYFAVITPDLKRHVMAGGVSEERVRVINNFAETESDVTPVQRKALDTPSNALVLLTLARLHEAKALDVVLEAIKDMPNAWLWMAGEGPAREMLEEQARTLGIENRVRFLGWRTDRAALLQAADICVFASRREPFGTVFAQAWANKTPVIVSDADGPRQFCRDEENCLMVPRDDAGALHAAISRLAENETLRSSLIDKGYAHYLTRFTKEASVTAYLDFYQDALGNEGSA